MIATLLMALSPTATAGIWDPDPERRFSLTVDEPELYTLSPGETAWVERMTHAWYGEDGSALIFRRVLGADLTLNGEPVVYPVFRAPHARAYLIADRPTDTPQHGMMHLIDFEQQRRDLFGVRPHGCQELQDKEEQFYVVLVGPDCTPKDPLQWHTIGRSSVPQDAQLKFGATTATWFGTLR